MSQTHSHPHSQRHVQLCRPYLCCLWIHSLVLVFKCMLKFCNLPPLFSLLLFFNPPLPSVYITLCKGGFLGVLHVGEVNKRQYFGIFIVEQITLNQRPYSKIFNFIGGRASTHPSPPVTHPLNLK